MTQVLSRVAHHVRSEASCVCIGVRVAKRISNEACTDHHHPDCLPHGPAMEPVSSTLR